MVIHRRKQRAKSRAGDPRKLSDFDDGAD